MLLAIDIGNTTVNVGIFKGKRLVFTKRIITKKPAHEKYYYAEFKKIIKNKKIDDAIISSVVPEVTTILKKIIKRGQFPNRNLRPHRELSPIILGEDLIVPIKNLYKNPKQVGQDRLVNAYAGYKKIGGGLIIIDFGTAVTFDVVAKTGAYMGGLIVPGIETSLKTLSEKAALLPQIKLKETKTIIGKDTVTSMLSGILNGYGAMCDGLVSKIKKEAGKNFKVILTGGHAKLISKFCDFDSIQQNLTLEGLNLIHKKFHLTKIPR